MKFVPLSPHAPVQSSTLIFCEKPPVVNVMNVNVDYCNNNEKTMLKDDPTRQVIDMKDAMDCEYDEKYNEERHSYEEETTSPYPPTMTSSSSSAPFYYHHHSFYDNHQSTLLLPPPPPLLLMPVCPPQRQRRLVVHFGKSSHNQVHCNPRGRISEREIARRWYNPHDYTRFQQDMRALVLETRHVEQYGYNKNHNNKSSQSKNHDDDDDDGFDSKMEDANNDDDDDKHHHHYYWRAPLLYVYQAFGTAQSPDQVQPVLDQVRKEYRLRITAHNVGLERLGIPDIQTDYQVRRYELWQQILAIQGMQHVLTAPERARHIAEAVEYYSRVGRLYARYTAYLAAKEEH